MLRCYSSRLVFYSILLCSLYYLRYEGFMTAAWKSNDCSVNPNNYLTLSQFFDFADGNL